MITEKDIIQGAQFTKSNGRTVEIVEVIPNYYGNATGVKTTINGKGDSSGEPYCDELTELVDFINN